MEFREVQKAAAEIVKKIDERLGVRRDEQLTISQLVEELGELARAVNSEKLGRGKIELEKLEDEFADVFIQFAALAELYKIDLENAVLEKMEILKERHGLEF